MILKAVILILASFTLASCSMESDTGTAPKNDPQRKPASEELTDKCLSQYGLSAAILRAETHQFSKDCSVLELPESSLVDHYKLKVEEQRKNDSCSQVDNLLVEIGDVKADISALENRKMAEASGDYDNDINKLKAKLKKLANSEVLQQKNSQVYIVPVKRHKLVDELAFLREQGLTTSLDSSDMKDRKLFIKSYLLNNHDQEFEDEKSVKIKNMFYCSLSNTNTSDQVFIEYTGAFNTRPFIKVFEAILD